jgi:hypothetical protein
MKMQFTAAAVLALLSLGACSADTRAANNDCAPSASQDPAPGSCATGNPLTALWSAITGGQSTAHAAAPAGQPSG